MVVKLGKEGPIKPSAGRGMPQFLGDITWNIPSMEVQHGIASPLQRTALHLLGWFPICQPPRQEFG